MERIIQVYILMEVKAASDCECLASPCSNRQALAQKVGLPHIARDPCDSPTQLGHDALACSPHATKG